MDNGLTRLLDCTAEEDSAEDLRGVASRHSYMISSLFFTSSPSRAGVERKLMTGYTTNGVAYD